MFWGSLFLITLGVFAIIQPFYKYHSSQYEKYETDYMTLSGRLINNPHYWTTSGKQSKTILRLELDSYPGAHFDNDYEVLDATDYQAVLSDIKFNDSVTIKVLKNDFENGFLKRNNYSPLQRVFSAKYNFRFYFLEFNGKEYVDTKNIGQFAEDRKMRMLCWNLVISIFFLFFGLRLLVSEVKKTYLLPTTKNEQLI